MIKRCALFCFSWPILLLCGSNAVAQNPFASQTAMPEYAILAETGAYADIADLVTIAPFILDAQIQKITKVPVEQAVGVPVNRQRLLIEATVIALIRGTGGTPSPVRFLLDMPKDAAGKIPKLKKKRLFILANYVTGRSNEIRLVRPNALVEYSAANEANLRAIAKEAVQLDAPQRVTGVTSAFHSPGSVIGDGETQIFLSTEKNQPMSITVTSRAGQPKIYAVSTSEVIVEASSSPQRYTLLWYRLACALPRVLSPELVESGDSENVARAQADYKFVIDTLGPCGRKR